MGMYQTYRKRGKFYVQIGREKFKFTSRVKMEEFLDDRNLSGGHRVGILSGVSESLSKAESFKISGNVKHRAPALSDGSDKRDKQS